VPPVPPVAPDPPLAPPSSFFIQGSTTSTFLFSCGFGFLLSTDSPVLPSAEPLFSIASLLASSSLLLM